MSNLGIFDFTATPGSFPGSVVTDRTTSQRSLWQAVYARRAEYTRPTQVRIKIGTWNVGALKHTEKDLRRWFVAHDDDDDDDLALDPAPGSETPTTGAWEEGAGRSQQSGGGGRGLVAPESEPATEASPSRPPRHDEPAKKHAIGLYVLGLQEIVDVTSAAEALRPFVDPAPSQRWKQALIEALPAGYEVVAEQQLVGLLLLVAASPSLASTVSLVSTTSVGTGVLGYLGNKGSVAARLVLGASTRMVFINCHLAAGSEKASLERRNWDAAQIGLRTKFGPSDEEAGGAEGSDEVLGDEDFAWWMGDLNYRIEGLPPEEVRRLLMLHIEDDATMAGDTDREGEEPETKTHGLSEASSAGASTDTVPNLDYPSLSMTISSLLSHDQLHKEQAARKAFHEGWREGSIKFLPTYKYDVGRVTAFDSSEKRRGPSWCDRILFRAREDQRAYKTRLEDEEQARRKDEDSTSRGAEEAADEDDDVLFDYDPDTDGAEVNNLENEGSLPPKNPDGHEVCSHGAGDALQLQVYTSRQEISSSDHKPVIGIFTVSYDAVVPELKAKIHREAARQMDQVENEERPGVTVVVDHTYDGARRKEDSAPQDTDAEGIEFGRVRYQEEKTRQLTIANTSRVTTRLEFLHGSVGAGEVHAAPPWLDLHLDPPVGDESGVSTGLDKTITISPGDALNVTIRAKVDDVELVRALNEGREELDHVLVLRVQEGRDHFIPIRAGWLPSCVGRSLEELARCPAGGVRALPQETRSTGAAGVARAEDQGSAPRTITGLTGAIEEVVENAVATWSMTQHSPDDQPAWELDPGWPFSQHTTGIPTNASIRSGHRLDVYEALDTGQPPRRVFAPGTPPLEQLETLCDVLLDLLASLKDGIITASMWTDEMEPGIIALEKSNKKAVAGDELRAWVFEVLSHSPVRHVSFVFLTSMLSRVTAELSATEARRRPSPDAAVPRPPPLTTIYAGIFADLTIHLPGSARDKEKRASAERRRRVIEVFLEEDERDLSR
ncbi:MAG: hypothetical protein M1826_007617 [Phylliscum demangeonii]|nr:MAG: hypothetical protein M1826_007617 [Phylliscum demangeonii]